jgi:hypothetical protein
MEVFADESTESAVGVFVINMTEAGIDTLTVEEMIALIKETGYFEGIRPETNIDFIETDTRANITGNFGLDKDWITSVIKYNNDGVDPTVNMFASFSANDTETYISVPQLISFDDGADKVKQYKLALDSVVTPQPNIFLKTTTIKDQVSDVQTVIEEYGQVVNLEEV